MDQAQNLRNIVKMVSRETEDRETEDKKARIITVTSGKGGVGKTSVSINLAIQFRKQGKSVIIFDADFGLANIEVMFGAVPKYNMSDLIYRGKDLKDIIVKGPMDIGFVSGGSGITNFGDISKDQIMYLVYKIKELESMADIIIIDTGAGISSAVMDFLVVSNEILLVMTPEPTSITDAYSLLKTLNKREDFSRETTDIKVITNKVHDYEEGINLYNKINVVVSKFLNVNIQFLGFINADENMSKAVIQQKPICLAYSDAKAAKDIEKISCVLSGIEYEDISEKSLVHVFLKRFKRNRQ